MDNDQRNAFLEHIHQKIDEFGWTIIAVGAAPESNSPQFAYTIGVSEKHGCELVMNGCGFEDMHHALNAVARRIADGKLTPRDGLLIEGVLKDNYLVRMKLVNPDWATEFPLVVATLGLIAPPPFWQVQFPAQDGKWPEDEGYSVEPYNQIDYTNSPLIQGA